MCVCVCACISVSTKVFVSMYECGYLNTLTSTVNCCFSFLFFFWICTYLFVFIFILFLFVVISCLVSSSATDKFVFLFKTQNFTLFFCVLVYLSAWYVLFLSLYMLFLYVVCCISLLWWCFVWTVVFAITVITLFALMLLLFSVVSILTAAAALLPFAFVYIENAANVKNLETFLCEPQ